VRSRLRSEWRDQATQVAVHLRRREADVDAVDEGREVK
jgi:hypothetical protein